MTGYQFTVTCRHCGALLDHDAGTRGNVSRVAAVAHCTECGSTYRLDITLSVLNGPAIRDTMPDVACRNPDAVGAPLINALLEAQR
jgi:NAD-dependent SIR2 family protein deacetylase